MNVPYLWFSVYNIESHVYILLTIVAHRNMYCILFSSSMSIAISISLLDSTMLLYIAIYCVYNSEGLNPGATYQTSTRIVLKYSKNFTAFFASATRMLSIETMNNLPTR